MRKLVSLLFGVCGILYGVPTQATNVECCAPNNQCGNVCCPTKGCNADRTACATEECASGMLDENGYCCTGPCCNGYGLNSSTGHYTEYSPEECGCPSIYQLGVSYDGGYSCCKDGFSVTFTEGGELSYNITPEGCGCPQGGYVTNMEPIYSGYTCCKNYLKIDNIYSNDPSEFYYSQFDQVCGCPDGGYVKEINNGDSSICCRDGYQWNIWDSANPEDWQYNWFNPYQCLDRYDYRCSWYSGVGYGIDSDGYCGYCADYDGYVVDGDGYCAPAGPTCPSGFVPGYDSQTCCGDGYGYNSFVGIYWTGDGWSDPTINSNICNCPSDFWSDGYGGCVGSQNMFLYQDYYDTTVWVRAPDSENTNGCPSETYPGYYPSCCVMSGDSPQRLFVYPNNDEGSLDSSTEYHPGYTYNIGYGTYPYCCPSGYAYLGEFPDGYCVPSSACEYIYDDVFCGGYNGGD